MLAMIPFVFIRFFQHDYPVAFLNLTSAILTGSSFFVVLITKKTEMAKISLSIVCFILAITTTILKGWHQIIWVYPVLTLFFAVLKPTRALQVSIVLIISISFLIYTKVSNLYVLGFIVSATATMIFAFAFTSQMHSQSDILKDLVIKDPLTGIANRRAFEEDMKKYSEQMKNGTMQSAAMVMLDIDYFKKINDDFGHSVGDLLLREFAMAIIAKIRKKDSLYRLGGEEFVVLLPHTDSKEAFIIAEGLRIEIENTDWSDPKLFITVSLGVAECIAGQNVWGWFERADKAMYKAKKEGRNKSIQCNEIKKSIEQ